VLCFESSDILLTFWLHVPPPPPPSFSSFSPPQGCLALPKLNLQFLTLHDYLLRNFNLFRLESTYEIRQDIEDVVARMKPWWASSSSSSSSSSSPRLLLFLFLLK